MAQKTEVTSNKKTAKSKSESKPIKLNLTPEQAVDEIIKGCVENGYCEIWSEYPFKEGKISSYYAPGQHPKYGMTKPITPEQLRDIEKILGPLTLAKLRVFLTENFYIAELNSLTWDEILLYFQRFVKRQNQQTKSTPKEQKQAMPENACDEIKNRFAIYPGQICFDGIDLKLPTGLTIEVFEKLYKNWGRTVEYKALDENSDKNEASIQLKSAKSNISKSFRKKKVPCIIENKPRTGYLMTEKTRQK